MRMCICNCNCICICILLWGGGGKRDGGMAPDEALGPGRRAGTWARWSPLAAVEGGQSRRVELGFGQKIWNLEKWSHLRFWGTSERKFMVKIPLG